MFHYFHAPQVKENGITKIFWAEGAKAFDGGYYAVNLQEGEDVSTQSVPFQEITEAEFKAAVRQSSQIAAINDIVAGRVATRYSVGAEIAMLKLELTHPKRAEYEAFVTECKEHGDTLKSEIGYF